MKKIKVDNIEPEKQLFHNEIISVYPMFLEFNDIKYWKNNLRTLLDFELLEEQENKELKDLTTEEITGFLAKRSDLQLKELAKSIERNGVRVPLIIKDDRTLLDGNRRYFASSLLYHSSKKKNETLEILKKIPVWVVKSNDLDPKSENKILAETNFVKDLRVPWPLDVKARVTSDMFNYLTKKENKDEDETYAEIEEIYSLKKNDAKAYVETIALTDEFISRAEKDKKKSLKLREIVLKKFLHFWEFRNKAMKSGRGALDEKDLRDIKDLFFKMMETERFKNFKQVEPMIKSYREKDLWAMLEDTRGIKLDEVIVYYNERKMIKSAEDKVRNFLKWLKSEKDHGFTKATNILLNELSDEILKK